MGSPGKHRVTGSGCGKTEGSACGNTVERENFCLNLDSAGDELKTGRAEIWIGPQSSMTVFMRVIKRVRARVPAAVSQVQPPIFSQPNKKMMRSRQRKYIKCGRIEERSEETQ